MKGDKPSCLSKRVMKVYRQNKTESTKLHEKLDHIEKAQVQSMILMKDSIRSLRQTSHEIKSVTEEMDVSQMRRKLFADHGCTLKEQKMNINDLIRRVDAIIHEPIGTPIPLIFDQAVATKGIEEEASDKNDNEYLGVGMDTKMPENENHYEGKPFQFRKIVPPLKGRKIEEVYKEMKREEKRLLKVRELADFRRRSEEFEIRRKGKAQQDSDNDMKTESRNLELENLNEITKMTESFESLLDDTEGDSTKNDDIDRANANNRNKCTASPSIGRQNATVVPSMAQFPHGMKRNRNAQNTRPLSCPPKSLGLNISTRTRKLAAPGIKMSPQQQTRRAWGENANIKTHAEGKNLKKKTKRRDKIRPKSCQDQLLHGRKISPTSPPPQRKLSSSFALENETRVRKISYGNGHEVDKEIVYDARPNDAMTTGYATLRMKVGGKSASVHIPKFKRDLMQNENITRRQKATNAFEIEKRRIQRIRNQLELEDFKE